MGDSGGGGGGGKPLRFSLGKGNNQSIVRETIMKRGRWVEMEKEDSSDADKYSWHLRWKQLSTPFNWDAINDKGYRQVFNHFESTDGVGTKGGLYRNMLTYFERRRENVFLDMPVTYLVRSGVKDADYHAFIEQLTRIEGSPNGIPLTARMCCSNCEVWQPSIE